MDSFKRSQKYIIELQNKKAELEFKLKKYENTYCLCEKNSSINDSIIGINECVNCGKPIIRELEIRSDLEAFKRIAVIASKMVKENEEPDIHGMTEVPTMYLKALDNELGILDKYNGEH